jgi:hypothetical protein
MLSCLTLLVRFTLPACDVVISPGSQLNVTSFTLDPESSVCIKTSSSPFFLILMDAPFDAYLEFYRPDGFDSSPALDYRIQLAVQPWSTRSLAPNSSFVLTTVAGGHVMIGTASLPFCPDALIAVSATAGRYLFSSAVLGNLRLNPSESKCLLVANENPTTVKLALDFSSMDSFFYCRTVNNCEKMSGVINRTFSSDAQELLLFRMVTADQGIHRAADFDVISDGEIEKFMYYGHNVIEWFTPSPSPSMEVIDLGGISIAWLIALIASTVAFFVFFSIVAVRYSWAAQCCGVECGRRQKPDPMPPSAFVGKRSTYAIQT